MGLFHLLLLLSSAWGAFHPLRLSRHRTRADREAGCVRSCSLSFEGSSVFPIDSKGPHEVTVNLSNMTGSHAPLMVLVPAHSVVLNVSAPFQCTHSMINADGTGGQINCPAAVDGIVRVWYRKFLKGMLPIIGTWQASSRSCEASFETQFRYIVFCKRQERCPSTPPILGWSTLCGMPGKSSCCDPAVGSECVLDVQVEIRESVNATTGVLKIVPGGSLRFVDNGGHYMFNARSILIEGGAFRAGTEQQLFGGSGSTLKVQLFGTPDESPVTCHQTECGVPTALWKSGSWDKRYPMDLQWNPSLQSEMRDYFYSYNGAPPFQPYAGGPTQDDGFFGSKVLAVSYGGSLELHGSWGVLPNKASGTTSWRRVEPVMAGSDQLHVTDADWNTVSPTWPTSPFQILLTTTDWHQSHNEVLWAKMGAGGVIQLLNRTMYDHLGAVELIDKTLHPNINRNSADLRPVAALLTRAITIESRDADLSQPFTSTFGGHIMARQGFASFRVEGVAILKLGQSGYKGRYSMHAHLCRLAPFFYFRHSTIWDSNNRFVSIHATANATVAGNVMYLATGSGVYLEDGSETHNDIVDNLSVHLRIGYKNHGNLNYTSNERNTFAVFCPPTLSVVQSETFMNYDCLAPAHFWIRNAHNRIQRNVAIGGEGSVHGYWFFAANMGKPSAAMRWDSISYFAGLQQSTENQKALYLKDDGSTLFPGGFPQPRAGYPVTLVFDENYSQLVKFHINTVGQFGGFVPIYNSPTNPLQVNFNSLWRYQRDQGPGGGPGTLPIGEPPSPFCPIQGSVDYSKPSLTNVCSASCGAGNDGFQTMAQCDAHVFSRHVGTFGTGTDINFASVWLRPYFFLVTDLFLSDIMGGGINFVSAGDATGVPIGMWGFTIGGVFMQNSQRSKSRYSLPRGPVYTAEATYGSSDAYCDFSFGAARTQCQVNGEGIVFEVGNFQYNTLMKVYDGPMGSINTAFLNVVADDILSECDPIEKTQYRTPYCVQGVPRLTAGGPCVLANIALGWKSPNGFAYPPRYVLDGLTFENVTIRHQITIPEFLPNSFADDVPATKLRYCDIGPNMLPTDWGASFTSIDRQTSFFEDGSLSGQKNSMPGRSNFVINNDRFLRSPNDNIECRSLNSSLVSPFHFYSLMFRPGGWLGPGSIRNDGIRRSKLYQMFRLSFDNAREDFLNAENPPAVWLQGPRGTGLTLAMEGTRYLVQVIPVDSSTPLDLYGPDGVANLNANCEGWLSPTAAPCCFPKPGTSVNCTDANNVIGGMQPRRPFDLSAPGQTFFVQLAYAEDYQEPNEFIMYVGSGFSLENDLYFVQYQKTDPPVAANFSIRGGFNNRPVADANFPIPATASTQPGQSPPGRRQIPYGMVLNDPSFFSQSGRPLVWNNHSAVHQMIQATYADGYVSIKFDFAPTLPAALKGQQERCGPIGICEWKNKCVCSRTEFTYPEQAQDCQLLCSKGGGVSNAECPFEGCFGFAVTVPSTQPYTPPDYSSFQPADWKALPMIARPSPWDTAFASRSLSPAQPDCPF